MHVQSWVDGQYPFDQFAGFDWTGNATNCRQGCLMACLPGDNHRIGDSRAGRATHKQGVVKFVVPLITLVVRGFVAAVVILMTTEWAAAAETLEDGVAAYRSGDYGKAVEVWRALADQGVAMAQYRLGEMYAEGKAVEQNDTTAMQWFQRAADQGIADAQYNVGASYAAGLGVARNDAEAAKWFRRAAEQGMAFAQLNLGLMYAAGRGVPQDNVEAMTWLNVAVFALPPGGARSDAARAMQDVADKMTAEQLRQASVRAKSWRARPEGK